MSKQKIIHKAGKRKTAIAKATLKKGSGKIRINHKLLELHQPEMYRLKIQEPLILADKIADEVDINVIVKGGGAMSQAESARLAIGRCLAEYSPKLKSVLLEYDRQLLVADVRYKETHKPNTHGHARSKKQKSYR
ncbi:30S ribosomal protein S9 [Candidatus Woesearchaeota archaeon]|nr:30S ribosomal protein S9 [Candidatus Woesearchaeota archaeon]